MPEGTAPGPATVTITGGPGPFQTPALVQSVSPGLFGAGGLAAAQVVTFRNGVQTTTSVLRPAAAGGLELVPIDPGTDDDQVFLILYGTGIRHHAGSVTARIGSQEIAASFAGPQGKFAGQDQINVPLPKTLKGAGTVDVVLIVDGQTTNAVRIQIQ
jgi:uncharacterized protein (TIGR03437 family)